MKVLSASHNSKPDIRLVIDHEMACLLYQISNYGGFTEVWPQLSEIRTHLRSVGVNYDPHLFQEVIEAMKAK